MGLNFRISKRTLTFKKPAGTSRGVMLTKDSWFIELFDDKLPERVGKGECSVIPGLTPDFVDEHAYQENISNHLQTLVKKFDQLTPMEEWYQELRHFPSLWFGVEMALIDLRNGGRQRWFSSPFTEGRDSIPVNGLIWMGDIRSMNKQIDDKLGQGYNCIKIKIGALDFTSEYRLLKQIRSRYAQKDLTIRVDANGAYDFKNAMRNLQKLAKLNIHSIEQPIKPGQWKELYKICQFGAIPVALDEELIGVVEMKQKEQLLDFVNPQYLILKPALHGGFFGCNEWINLTENKRIGWWVTSALESNLGLEAIAQWTAGLGNPFHQGLGTGALYVENLPTRLLIDQGRMYYRP